jgi:D-arabinan exo beta-(1,2)-arabinofuranosidase (non-reducing end)
MRSAAGISGDSAVAAFPLGGIGTGNVSLGARGDLRDWELFNRPGKGLRLPYTFFALRVANGGTKTARVLEARLRPPHGGPMGYFGGEVAGLPRLTDSVMRGEYPFVWVDFVDEALPVSVGLEAFTPLVPLDSVQSGLPTAILRYRVVNLADSDLEVSVAASAFNPVGIEHYRPSAGWPDLPKMAGQPLNSFRGEETFRGLFMSTTLPTNDVRFGSIALTTSSPSATAKREWLRPDWVGIEDFWRDFCEDGNLVEPVASDSFLHSEGALEGPAQLLEGGVAQDTIKTCCVGSLAVSETLQAGEHCVFEFILTWHFPNRPRAWLPAMHLEPTHADQIVRNHYATKFDDAWDVAAHVHRELPSLELVTRQFHRDLYNSSLPLELLESATANIATLRSTTCFRLDDGTFAGWEGTFDESGSCEGSCTHVWNYAQTAAFLFPDLERSMRRAEFELETEPDGKMNFRANGLFGGSPSTAPPAVDGQLGAILRVFREWKLSGDDDFLRELWPMVAKATDFALGEWDTDGDGVLDGEQHTTYDVEFFGATSYANSFLIAALRAATEMATYCGDTSRAQSYGSIADKAANIVDALLWNGDYYNQDISDIDEHPHQYGNGCLSDQLIGQFFAHLLGLGYILPKTHVRSGLRAVFRHNFRSPLATHENYMRSFALHDEAGLLVCTWPNGGRPRHPVPFADEVWTGIEYQVAAHLLYEGFPHEACEIVRAVRARHDGYRRNPWSEAEAGYHYARSMASWALIPAYCGFSYDAPQRAIGFVPAGAIPDVMNCFFSMGTGWGVFDRAERHASLELRQGTLELRTLRLRASSCCDFEGVFLNGAEIEATETETLGSITIELAVSLAAGDVLTVTWSEV